MASDQRAEPAPIYSEPLAHANGEAIRADDPPFPTDAEAQEWEAKVQSWLSSTPVGREAMACEIDSWINSDLSSVPDTLKTLPRSQLRQRIHSLHKRNASPEIKNSNQDDPPRPRFVRTDQWISVYSWLESFDANEVVRSKDISEWLSENPKVKEQLYARHSRYHLMHYIQKLHLKMSRKREKMKKGSQPIQPSIARTSLPIRTINDGEVTGEDPFAELQDQLGFLLARHRNVNRLRESSLPALSSQQSAGNIGHQVPVTVKEEGIISATTGSTSPLDSNSDKKRKRIDEVVTPAWSCSEASAGMQLPSLDAICDASQSV